MKGTIACQRYRFFKYQRYATHLVAHHIRVAQLQGATLVLANSFHRSNKVHCESFLIMFGFNVTSPPDVFHSFTLRSYARPEPLRLVPAKLWCSGVMACDAVLRVNILDISICRHSFPMPISNGASRLPKD